MTNTKKIIIGTLIMSSTCLTAMSANAAPSTQDFVTKASVAGKFEVDSSMLALQKTSDSDVKSVAQMMVYDHTNANNELKETLKNNHISATPATKLDAKHQALLNKLQAASGRDFDNQYIAIQKDAHVEAINLFTDYSQHGKSAPVKAFATNTLPTLKTHLSHLQQLGGMAYNNESPYQCRYTQRNGMESVPTSNSMSDRASVNASPSYLDRTYSANWDYAYFGIPEQTRAYAEHERGNW